MGKSASMNPGSKSWIHGGHLNVLNSFFFFFFAGTSVIGGLSHAGDDRFPLQPVDQSPQ